MWYVSSRCHHERKCTAKAGLDNVLMRGRWAGNDSTWVSETIIIEWAFLLPVDRCGLPSSICSLDLENRRYIFSLLPSDAALIDTVIVLCSLTASLHSPKSQVAILQVITKHVWLCPSTWHWSLWLGLEFLNLHIPGHFFKDQNRLLWSWNQVHFMLLQEHKIESRGKLFYSIQIYAREQPTLTALS